MRWPDFRFLAVFIPLALPLALVTSVSAAPDPAPASTPSTGQKIDLPVPVGEPVKGIKIPQYDEGGKLTFCLTADTAKKLDDRQVELGKLKVQFNEKEDKEIVVEIPHSFLDLETKVLTADSETVIRRQDFDIVGESAVFDTLSRQGTFKGHVRASFANGAPIEITPKPTATP